MKSYLRSYLRSLKYRKNKNTARTYEQGVKTYAEIVGVNTPPSIEAYVSFLQAIMELNPNTRRSKIAAVMDFYKFMIDEGGLQINLVSLQRANRRYSGRQSSLIVFDEEAIRVLLNYVENLSGDLQTLRDRAFILTLADTGLRIAESLALLRGDIIWKTKSNIIKGKGDKMGKIRYSDRCINAIQRYLKARAKLDGKTGIPLNDLPLFARHDKKAGQKILPIQAHGMESAFQVMCQAAGLQPGQITPHKLRHWFVTNALRKNNGNLRLVQELARHTTIDQTGRYAHLADEEVQAGYERAVNL